MERWKLNLYIIVSTQFFATMSMQFGMPFIPYFIQELGATDPDRIKLYTAISAMAPAIGMGISSPFWGMLADRHGKKLMIMRAVFMASLVFIGMGFVANVTHLLLLRFLQGFFTGTVAASNAYVASNIPENELSFSFGSLTSARFLGMTIGPAVGGLIAEAFGYRTSFFIGGFLLLANGFSALLFLKEKKVVKIKEKQTNNPFASVGSVLKKPVILTIGMILIIVISRTVFKPYLPLLVQDIRQSVEGSSRITGIISAIIAVASAVSGIIIGRMADRYDKTKIILFSVLTGILISSALSFTDGLVMFTVFYSLTMFAIGGVEPVLYSLASSEVNSEKRGTLFGFISTISAFGFALASLLGSAIAINISIPAILYAIPAFLAMMLGVRYLYIKYTDKATTNIQERPIKKT